MQKADQAIPRARKHGLLVQELNGEVLVYDLDRHKAHCLNESAALIWRHCDGRTPVPEMIRILENEGIETVDPDVVRLGLRQLERSHLLETHISQSDGAGLRRRDLIKKIGLAAAIGLPLVTSIVSPRAAEAATCAGSLQDCTSRSCCAPCTCNVAHLCVGC